MDYMNEFSYFNFMQAQIEEQRKLKRYIQECVIISEGVDVLNKISVLNEEEEKGSITRNFEKVKAFIVRIWNKFVEKSIGLLNNEVGYLNKYKDTILKKQVKIDVTMREYEKGIRRMISTIIPSFSPSLLDKIDNKEGADNVTIKKMLISEYNTNENFDDFAKIYFQGGENEKEVSANAINIKNMFDYCMTYRSKIVPALEKDKKNIEKAGIEAQKYIQSQIATRQQTAPSQSTQNPTPKPAATQTQTSESYFGKKVANQYVYSEVYGIISEVDIKSNNDPQKDSSGKTSVAANIGGKVSIKTNDNAEEKAALDNNTSDKSEDVQQKANIYTSLLQIVFTAKMTAAEKIFLDYMKIIKAHVSSHIDTDMKDKDQGVQKASDFSPEEKQQ